MPTRLFSLFQLNSKLILTEKELFTLQLVRDEPRIRTPVMQTKLHDAGMQWTKSDREIKRGSPHKMIQNMGLITNEMAGRYKEWLITQLGNDLLNSDAVTVKTWDDAQRKLNNGFASENDDWQATVLLFELFEKKTSDANMAKLKQKLPPTVVAKLETRVEVKNV